MQCLALSHEIQTRFPDCEVEVVDYTSLAMENNYKVRFKKKMLRDPMEFFRKIERKKIFRDSLKYLPLSPEPIIDDKCDKVFEYLRGRYDVVIVGSDAVWNWIKRGFPNPYILDMNDGPVRLSYAASAFGMSMRHVTEDRRVAFGRSLGNFRFIGVRDAYTEGLVHHCIPDAKTYFNCDPTAFLDLDYVMSVLGTNKEDFKEKIYQKYKIPSDKRLICTMGTNRHLVRKLKNKYRSTHRIISVFSSTGEEDYFLNDLDPLEWSLIFGLADVTLTNFFHGTMLSLRNSTPVISIDHTKFGLDYKGKLQDVLEKMDLGDCFFTLPEALSDDWEEVVGKADELINDENIRDYISNNLLNMTGSSESFFDALGEVVGYPNTKKEVPEMLKRKREFRFTSSAKCMGCMLCAEKCPQKAINFEVKNGFYQPSINGALCTECGLCNSVCPVNQKKKSNEPEKVYALCDKNEDNRKAASSGGAVGLLAEHFFRMGGVISGVVYDENMCPVHRIARNMDEFAPMRGSKYVQSSMDGIYTELEAELESGKAVLAVGMPCQVAALKKYFGDRFDNLYTCDLICHGVQSPVVFDSYVDELEKKYRKKVIDFKFRDKTNGWKKSNVKVIFEDGEELIMTRAQCDYFEYFNYLRSSCYHCHFRNFNNYSDITVGDYWGIETLCDEFSDDKGVSILLCHTEKGRELCEEIMPYAKVVDSNLEHAIKTHKKLKRSIGIPPPRNGFFRTLHLKGYKAARAYYKRKTLLYRIKIKIKKMLGVK